MIKIGGFEPKSNFSKVLIPVLDALEWNGSNTEVIESLVDDANNMNKDGFIETMANLKIKTHVSKLKHIKKENELLPCLYILNDRIILIINKKENFLVFDTYDSAYKEVDKLPKGQKVIIFSKLDNVSSNLLKPQKNWFFNLITRFKKEFIYIIFISILLTILSFLTPLIIMLIHGQIRLKPHKIDIIYLGGIALIFILGVIGLKALRSYLLTYLSGRIGNLVSNEIFRRILYLPPKYIDTSSIKAQLSRVKDFESITDFFSSPAILALIDIPLSLLMIIGLVFISGYVAFVPLTSYIIMLVLGYFSYNYYKNINSRDINNTTEKNKIQNEMLLKMSAIRVSGNKQRWFKEYDFNLAKSLYSSYKSSSYLFLNNTFAAGIINMTLILSLTVSVLRVIQGDFPSSSIFATFIIISRILSPLRRGFSTIAQLSKLNKSIIQLNKFMTLPIEGKPVSINMIEDQLSGDINFNNLFLKYGQEITPSLLNIKFKHLRNTTTVISGHGGCGKSSLLKVLMGLYTPLSGNITINNINLMQLDRIQLRKSISYLPATPFLFPGTIKSNLYLAKPDASDGQIKRVLKKTGIYNDIEKFPNGVNCNIDSLPAIHNTDSFIKKINLSMMLLRNSPLLLIDSIENGLSKNDYKVFIEILENLKGNTTIIITTNNSSFINIGDKMLTMDSGRIIRNKSE